jgi:hypothetical protein
MAAEGARADVRDERGVWRDHRQVRMREPTHRLVFLDETYVNTKMTRLRGRSHKGERLRMSAPWIIDGPIARQAFGVYIETQLAPTPRQGDVVILDNLAVHKSEKAMQCLKQKGSNHTCAKPKLEPLTRFGAPLATSATCSSLRNVGITSRPQDMQPIKRPML